MRHRIPKEIYETRSNPGITPGRGRVIGGTILFSLIAFIARFSIAAVFWKSGQTKIEGLAIDLVEGALIRGVENQSPAAKAGKPTANKSEPFFQLKPLPARAVPMEQITSP